MVQTRSMTSIAVLTIALAGTILSTSALAERPAHAGNGKPDRQLSTSSDRNPGARPERRDDRRHNEVLRSDDKVDSRERGRNPERDSKQRQGRDSGLVLGTHFTDRHVQIVRRYYGESYRSGHCPPGLAKRQNGCMPPGLTKQWRIGQPLPRHVDYYDAPRDIVLHFGMPPEGHRYVRVAADILLIAVGTGLVVDALQDLNRM